MEIPERLPMLLAGALKEGLKLKGIPKGECPEEWILENSSVSKNSTRLISRPSQIFFIVTIPISFR